jgi:hypothetical protein
LPFNGSLEQVLVECAPDGKGQWLVVWRSKGSVEEGGVVVWRSKGVEPLVWRREGW